MISVKKYRMKALNLKNLVARIYVKYFVSFKKTMEIKKKCIKF